MGEKSRRYAVPTSHTPVLCHRRDAAPQQFDSVGYVRFMESWAPRLTVRSWPDFDIPERQKPTRCRLRAEPEAGIETDGSCHSDRRKEGCRNIYQQGGGRT
jgi:hypothetical protein